MMSQAPSIRESESIAARYAGLHERIAEAARRAGRDARDVRLVAVSKTHRVAAIREAIAAGAIDFGENRVQEAATKIEIIGRTRARWHLIGHLQANKAGRAVGIFDVIHSVDSVELIRRLERLCIEVERVELPVLIQVDLGGEATKNGISIEAMPDLIDAFDACGHVKLVGLMTLPPYFENAGDVRPYFRRLREMRDEWRGRGVFASSSSGGYADGELSMGMSHDFEIAIEEGATMVRVGTQLFGAREQMRTFENAEKDISGI